MPVEISGRSLSRHTLLNLIGQAIPLLVGVIAIPFIVRGLGPERFGLLSLTWVVLGYFTVFDLGLARASTKYVAEALGRGEEDQVPKLIWAAVSLQTLVGLLGALALVLLTPLLVERLLSIPLALKAEAQTTLFLLSLSIPVLLVCGSLVGALDAAQRFDLSNFVRASSSAVSYLLTLCGVLLGFSLPGIVGLVVLSRLMTLLVLFRFSIAVFPLLRVFAPSLGHLLRLFSYGVWITVSNIVGPLLAYLDRFLIASLLPMSALAYYTAPYEAVTRLWIIPTSLAITLFSAFSALEGMGDRRRQAELSARAVKYTLLSLGPIALMLALFAHEVLSLWLGREYAMQATTTVRVLALGVLIHSLAYAPAALLQGMGRPDITAKFHLVELPLYAVLLWALVSQWGIVGAAIAWALRVALDTCLVFIASFKIFQLSPSLFMANGLTLTAVVLGVLSGLSLGLKGLSGAWPLPAQGLLFAGLLCIFLLVVWRTVLDVPDKCAVRQLLRPTATSDRL